MIEEAKRRLTENPDFNSIEAFRRLTDEDIIRLSNIKHFLRDNGISPSDEELDLLHKTLDRDSDGVISWGEYLNSCINREFSPDDNNFPHSWKIPREIPVDIEKALANVLLLEIQGSQHIEDAKQNFIADFSAFDIEQMFDAIDTEQKDYISLVNLWSFIKSESNKAELKIAELCFRRLDLDFDARIGIDDWFESLRLFHRPQHPIPQSGERASSSPRIDADYPDSGPSRLNTQSDFRFSGNKFGNTYRSTADKTFSDSRYGWGSTRSPIKGGLTETIKPTEDSARVNNRGTASVTRKLDVDPLKIVDEYKIDQNSAAKGHEKSKREDTQGSDYKLKEGSTNLNQNGTHRSGKPLIDVENVIPEEDGNEEDGSPTISKLQSKKPSISENPQNTKDVTSIIVPAPAGQPKNNATRNPRPQNNASTNAAPNPPNNSTGSIGATQPNKLQGVNPILAESAVINTKLEPTNSNDSNYTRIKDILFHEHAIETKRSLVKLPSSSDLGFFANHIGNLIPKRYLSKPVDQTGGQTSRTSYSIGSHMDLNSKNDELRKNRGQPPRSDKVGRLSGPKHTASRLQQKAEELKQARKDQKEKRKAEGPGMQDDEQDIFKMRVFPDVPNRQVDDDYERYLYSHMRGNYEGVCHETALKENADGMPYYVKMSESHYQIDNGVYGKGGRASTDSDFNSRLGFSEKLRLVQYLIEFVRDFRLIEQKRMNLAMRFDFTLKELFVLADDSKGNCISTHDFVKFLKRIGVDVTFDDSLMLFAAYDNDRDRYLSFNEFSAVFTPFNAEFRDMLLTRSQRRVTDLSLYDTNTMKALKDCAATVFNAEQKYNHYKDELKGRLHELFDMIDARHTGRLTLTDFKRLFGEHQFHASEMEIAAIMQRLDCDQDGMITADEFLQSLKKDTAEYERDYLARRGMKPKELWLDVSMETTTKSTTTTKRDSHYCSCPCNCRLKQCACKCGTFPCETVVHKDIVEDTKHDYVPYRTQFGDLALVNS